MNRLIPLTVAVGLLGVAACSNGEDVVQQPAEGQVAVPVEGDRADAAMQNTAQYFGMTREQLEDADLLSTDNTDLGDVETLVTDPQGRLTHVVVELEGPGDPKVQVPVGDLQGVEVNGEKDLATALTAAELQAMPGWTPETPVPARQ